MGINMDVVDPAQVQHETTVTGTEPGHAVAASTHRQQQFLFAREVDRMHNVGSVDRLHDHRRALVVHGVVHRPGRIVAGIRWLGQRATQTRPQSFDR
jgi:hypothetical protein